MDEKVIMNIHAALSLDSCANKTHPLTAHTKGNKRLNSIYFLIGLTGVGNRRTNESMISHKVAIGPTYNKNCTVYCRLFGIVQRTAGFTEH